jgi:catechol 2,3-dioxygenase-like lactoylglutathione lyase family enzyme
MEISGVHHIAVKVADLARAESFYVSVLGLPVVRRWPASDAGQDRSVWFDLGAGAFLALERGETGPRKSENGSGMHLLALRIRRDQREVWASKLAQAGYAVYQQTSFTLYVLDPEGNRIGLSHWPEPWPA